MRRREQMIEWATARNGSGKPLQWQCLEREQYSAS